MTTLFMHGVPRTAHFAKAAIIAAGLGSSVWSQAHAPASAPANEVRVDAPPTGPAATAPEATATRISVTYDPSIAASYTGRVYLMTQPSSVSTDGDARPGREPRYGPSWFNTRPFFGLDVVDWKPGEPLVFDDRAIGFPCRLSDITPGLHELQAVMRLNLDSPHLGSAAGNAYSPVVTERLAADDGYEIQLTVSRTVEQRPFEQTQRLRLVEHRSDLLSAFHGRDVIMRAVVVLPETYDREPERRYPVLYWIGGFGDDHRSAPMIAHLWSRTGQAQNIVRVVLDASCLGGHHAFADSDNNGPRATALVKEFIPHLEQSFRLVSAPTARFLTGHSSGGWSSLWLQIAHPEFFGGVWSVAPDPVDFTDFQGINLYASGANMYVDEHGDPRPLARSGDQVLLKYRTFAEMEVVYGEGGQLRSFEWVFSRKGADGLPEQLFDRATGAVDPDVARSWKRFDIRAVMEENWTSLAPSLKGKVHVFMGAVDTFYLDGAARRLKASQEQLNSDAVIEIVDGRDHGSIADSALRQRIDNELLAVFDAAHPEFKRPGNVYD